MYNLLDMAIELRQTREICNRAHNALLIAVQALEHVDTPNARERKHVIRTALLRIHDQMEPPIA